MRKQLVLLLICITTLINAQDFNIDDYTYSIQKIDKEIVIDGILDDEAWGNLPQTSGFWEHFPNDTAREPVSTSLKLAYNDKMIYIGVWFKEENAEPVIQNLIRDDNGPFWRSDAFSVIIDPTNTNSVGYFFALNAGGAKQDGIVSQQGLQPALDMYWNNAWEAEVTYDQSGYYYEFAIPFDAIKYNKDITTWGINFIRNDLKRNAFYIWTKFGAAYHGMDFNYNGEVSFQKELPKSSGKRLELKPAVSGSIKRDFENNGTIDYSVNAGLDAKYAVTENINLDVALLPDFSTVEVDKQYIDFYRYEYKVDEQREFFLENNDIFSKPGSDEDFSIVQWDAYRVKPFYTRRIGIKNWQHTPISYGVRLTGNATNDLRLGILNMQVQPYEDDLAQNYSAFGIKQSFLKRGTITGLILNRQSIGNFDTENGQSNSDYLNYSRNAGLEFDFINKKNTFSSSYKYHRSINPETNKNVSFYGADFDYRSSKFRNKLVLHRIDDNYMVDMGYTPRLYHKDALNDTTYRKAYSELSNYSSLTFYPGKKIRVIQFNSRLNSYSHDQDGLNEIKYQFSTLFENDKFAKIIIGVNYSKFDMLFANDVLKNDNPLPAGIYEDLSANIILNSSEAKAVRLNVLFDYGKFYNGTKLSTENSLILRVQPWGVFTISHNMFQYELPDLNQQDTYHLIGGRAEINFTRDVSWTTLVQYNTQFDNINVNSLFKWRFKPLSEFYFVIKDDTDLVFNQKRFQLVAKLNYWFKI